MKGDVQRYLDAKESVDDRALDRALLDRLVATLATAGVVLEAGAGTGAALRRVLGLATPAALSGTTWLAVDTDADSLARAADRVAARARECGYAVDEADSPAVDPPAGDVVATLAVVPNAGERRGSDARRFRVGFLAGDVRTLAARLGYDVLVAQAFVDLLSPADAVALVDTLDAGGEAYLPITFDGGTAFEPSHPADDAVLDAYHAVMDADGRLGSTAASTMESRLTAAGFDVASADSTWVVDPDSSGGYPAEESYFLGVIVDTVAATVRERLDDAVVDDWQTARQQQRRSGSLGYRAENRDLYVDAPADPTERGA